MKTYDLTTSSKSPLEILNECIAANSGCRICTDKGQCIVMSSVLWDDLAQTLVSVESHLCVLDHALTYSRL